jgi:hypothetical protein
MVTGKELQGDYDLANNYWGLTEAHFLRAVSNILNSFFPFRILWTQIYYSSAVFLFSNSYWNTVSSKFKVINSGDTVFKITYYKTKISDSGNINNTYCQIPWYGLLRNKKLKISVLLDFVT